MLERIARWAVVASLLAVSACGGGGGGTTDDGEGPPAATAPPAAGGAGVLFLHHSTGQNVWDGGVSGWFDAYNQSHGTAYRIEERAYPDSPWPWDNYPSDYYRLWVLHEGSSSGAGTEWLETMASGRGLVIFKHCFPGFDIWPDSGSPDPASSDRTLENYRAAYAGLKDKLHQFPNTRFLVWTLATRTEAEMFDLYGSDAPEMAARAREFTDWTKRAWDEPGDNIFVFDFYALETEGALYLDPRHASDPQSDSHPNEAFSAAVAPLLSQRIVDVLEGRGDSGSLTGD
jgi:hypothetical protein